VRAVFSIVMPHKPHRLLRARAARQAESFRFREKNATVEDRQPSYPFRHRARSRRRTQLHPNWVRSIARTAGGAQNLDSTGRQFAIRILARMEYDPLRAPEATLTATSQASSGVDVLSSSWNSDRSPAIRCRQALVQIGRAEDCDGRAA